MYWDVLEVKYIAGRELAVRFADGLAGILYIDHSFCTGVFEPLQNDDLVSLANVDNGVLVWPNGLDLAPDTMYHEIKRNPNRRYELSR
jgi:hypothetical protein